MKKMDQRNRWSALPKELLIEIFKNLDTKVDNLRLRSVCSSWRSAVPLFCKSRAFSIHLPILTSTADNANPPQRLNRFFTLSEITIYRFEPLYTSPNPNPWLVKIRETKSNTMVLLNPLTRCPMVASESFPKVLNLLDFRVSVISKDYSLALIDEIYGDYVEMRSDERRLSCITKMALSSKPVSSVLDYKILAIRGNGKLCSLRVGDNKWSLLDCCRTRFIEVVNYGGRFYAADSKGRVMAYDESTIQLIEVLSTKIRGTVHLVESFGDLLLVAMDMDTDTASVGFNIDTYMMPKFRIYKLNVRRGEWEKVETLGDRTLFLSGDGCFSISSRDFPMCEGNCIYYASDKIQGPDAKVFVFSLKDHTTWPAKYWGYSNILWPLPL